MSSKKLCYEVFVGGIVIVWENLCYFNKEWVGSLLKIECGIFLRWNSLI